MALSTYSELKAAALDWMTRADLTGNTADWITLAEARLNRELNPVEVDQTLTGTLNSREIDVSAYSIVEALALYIVDSDTSDEAELTQKSDFARDSTSEEPVFWDYLPHASTGKIIFDCPLDAAYTFRFRYRQRFALSDSNTTNWLLTNHPDLYLSATLVWGSGFVEKFQEAGAFKSMLDESLASVKSIISQSKRAVLTVDPALRPEARDGSYDGTE
jgi:hypothetical protein